MKNTELWRKTVLVAMDYVAGRIQRGETETGKYGIWMELAETKNVGLLMVEPSAMNAHEYTLTIRVMREGTDLSMMHFIKTAALEDILCYLQAQENADELLDSLAQLSEGIDNRY